MPWPRTGSADPAGDRGLPLEILRLEPMANGWSDLLLTERVGWEGLPRFAEALASCLGARLEEAVDGPDVRMRSLRLGVHSWWVVFDDFPWGVTLQPRSAGAARELPALQRRLIAWRDAS